MNSSNYLVNDKYVAAIYKATLPLIVISIIRDSVYKKRLGPIIDNSN